MMKYIIGWESNGKKVPIIWEKYVNQFPRFSPYNGFCCIFLHYGKLKGNPCISHMMKYTIRWESDGKKVSILWGKLNYQFPRFSPCISHMMRFVNFFMCTSFALFRLATATSFFINEIFNFN